MIKHNNTGPRVGDTAQKLMMVEGIGTCLVPVVVTRVIRSSTPDYPYLVTFEHDFIAGGVMHAGETMTRLNSRGEDQHTYTVNYRRPERDDYLVPIDPMDEFNCDTCQ